MIKPPASPAPLGAPELGVAVRHVATCPTVSPPAQPDRDPTVLVLLLQVAHGLDGEMLDQASRMSSQLCHSMTSDMSLQPLSASASLMTLRRKAW